MEETLKDDFYDSKPGVLLPDDESRVLLAPAVGPWLLIRIGLAGMVARAGRALRR